MLTTAQEKQRRKAIDALHNIDLDKELTLTVTEMHLLNIAWWALYCLTVHDREHSLHVIETNLTSAKKEKERL